MRDFMNEDERPLDFLRDSPETVERVLIAGVWYDVFEGSLSIMSDDEGALGFEADPAMVVFKHRITVKTVSGGERVGYRVITVHFTEVQAYAHREEWR
jgi:hypothetical protein